LIAEHLGLAEAANLPLQQQRTLRSSDVIVKMTSMVQY